MRGEEADSQTEEGANLTSQEEVQEVVDVVVVVVEVAVEVLVGKVEQSDGTMTTMVILALILDLLIPAGMNGFWKKSCISYSYQILNDHILVFVLLLFVFTLVVFICFLSLTGSFSYIVLIDSL